MEKTEVKSQKDELTSEEDVRNGRGCSELGISDCTGYFYVNLTQAKVTREEGASIEKTPL